MGEPVVYEFIATGVDEVTRAFASVSQAADQSAKATEGAYARTARAATDAAAKQKAAAEKAAAAEAKAAEKSAKDAERAEQKRWKEVEKTAAKIQREFDKEAKSAEKAAQRKVKADEAAAKAAEKAEQRKVKATKRAEDQRWKEVERTAARIEREEARSAKRAEAAAKRRAKAQAAAHEQVNAETFGRISRVGVGLAAAGAVAVGALVGKAVLDATGTQSLANRISVAGRAGGQAGVDPAIIRRELEATAIAHAGQTAEGVAGGISAFQQARGGDRSKALEEARKFSDVFATFASETGESAEEFGKLGAVLARKYDVKSVEDMGNAIAMVVAHARESGQPLEEAVEHFDKLSSSAKRFGIKDLGQLGALTSIASQGAGAEQADRAVDMLLRQLLNPKVAQRLHGRQIDIYKNDKSGQINPLGQTIAALFAKTGPADNFAQKKSDVIQAVGGARSFAAISPLFDRYVEAFGKATGSVAEKTQAAQDAVVAAFDQAAQAAGSYADTQIGAKQAESDSQAQLTAAYEQVKAIVGAQLAPELAQLATELARDPGAIQEFTEGIKAAAAALRVFGKIAGAYMKFSGVQHDVYAAAYHHIFGGGAEGDEDGAPQPPAPINPATGLPGYATAPGANGQPLAIGRAGAFGGGPPLLNPGSMPPAVGAVPGPIGPQATAFASGAARAAGPGPQGAAAQEAAAAKLAASADKLSASADKLGAIGGKGDVFGGRHSAVDPS